MKLQSDDTFFFVNGRAGVVVLQPIGGAANFEAGLAFYNSVADFGIAYDSARMVTRNYLGLDLRDFDETFVLEVGGQELAVHWNNVILPIDQSEPWRFQILLEALFILGLCKDAEACLTKLLSNAGLRGPVKDLLEYVRDVIVVEQPEHYLISSAEIDLMRHFYAGWRIGERVKSLQTRFSQAIDTFNLSYSRIQALTCPGFFGPSFVRN